MSTFLAQRQSGSSGPEDVNDEAPLAVKSVGPVQVGRTLDSGWCGVSGVVTGAAYADADAIGTGVVFPNVLRPEALSGTIYTALYLDADDEGLAVDLHLFRSPPAYVPTDNGAYAPGDAALEAYCGTISFASFSNFGVNQVSVASGVGIAVANAAGTALYGQVVARGALNIAADNQLRFRLVVLAD